MNNSGDRETRATLPFAPNEAGDTPVLKDRRLVLAAQSGCRLAFDELCAIYSRRVYHTLLGIVRNPQDAEDAMQDAFLRAYLAIGSFERRANFNTWLTRIAINSALCIMRKRRCRPEAPIEANLRLEDEGTLEEFRDSAPNPEQIYEEQEKLEKLRRAILQLPLLFRTVIQMRVSGDWSVKEVAFRLDISEPAVKARLYRARIMLASLTSSCAR